MYFHCLSLISMVRSSVVRNQNYYRSKRKPVRRTTGTYSHQDLSNARGTEIYCRNRRTQGIEKISVPDEEFLTPGCETRQKTIRELKYRRFSEPPFAGRNTACVNRDVYSAVNRATLPRFANILRERAWPGLTIFRTIRKHNFRLRLMSRLSKASHNLRRTSRTPDVYRNEHVYRHVRCFIQRD